MKAQKKIMILGGGYYQLPLIKKSVDLGYYTIVCGIKGNYPGYKYADLWLDVDTFNKEAVLSVTQKYKIDGILLCGTDACMPTIGYVCDKMHLIGPSEESTIAASNKAEMKKRFVANGVRTAYYQKIFSFEEAEQFAKQHKYPVVLKVVDASGSKGIAIVHNEKELTNEYELVRRETKLDYIVIEEFVKGEEFGAQAFVRNGKLTFVMPHGDVTYHGVTDVPIGHYAPYERTDELKNDIVEQLTLCVRALGINNTAINADFILSKGKVYVLEIGARAGATCLPELVSCHYDVDYYEYLLRMCVGENMSFPQEPKYASWVETLQTQQNGVVKSIEIPEMPKEVQEFCLYPQVGDVVRPFRNAYDRIGTLVMKGKNLNELKILRDRLLEGLKFTTR